LVIAALYRSVTCPCSAIPSCLFVASVVLFIDTHVKIRAPTATRLGSAVRKVCIWPRGGRGVTGRPGRAHLGSTRRPVAGRGARQNDEGACPVRPVRLSGIVPIRIHETLRRHRNASLSGAPPPVRAATGPGLAAATPGPTLTRASPQAASRVAHWRKFFVDAGVLPVGDQGTPGGRPLAPVSLAPVKSAALANRC
jgi:hypothetical protein